MANSSVLAGVYGRSNLNKQAADGSTSDNLVDMRLFALPGMPIASMKNMSMSEVKAVFARSAAAGIDAAVPAPTVTFRSGRLSFTALS
jgi:hypothetical protein